MSDLIANQFADINRRMQEIAAEERQAQSKAEPRFVLTETSTGWRLYEWGILLHRFNSLKAAEAWCQGNRVTAEVR